MGQLWDLYEEYLDRRRDGWKPPSQREAAERLGMSPTAFGNWRHGLSRMPDRRNLLAFADLIGASYSRVVDAALVDARYMPEQAARDAQLAESMGKIRGRKRPVSTTDVSTDTA